MVNNEYILAPSILTADFSQLGNELKMLNESYADWIHIDVMDGVFVPNISFGFPVIESIKKNTNKPLDVHLMIVEPDRYFDRFIDVGADILTVHYEACTHLQRTITSIKERGIKAGVALNPHTNVSLLEDVITDLDMVLIMTVNPGYGGQHFIENSFQKIIKMKQMINESGADTIIEVDGGVSLENIKKLKEVGVDAFVAGNSVFAAPDPIERIEVLKSF